MEHSVKHARHILLFCCTLLLLILLAWVVIRYVAIPTSVGYRSDDMAYASPAELGMMLLADNDDGLYVLAVSENSVAAAAGVLPGDHLTAVNGTRLTLTADLSDALDHWDGRNAMTVTITRGGVETSVDLLAPCPDKEVVP